MSQRETELNVLSEIPDMTLNRYRLDIPSCLSRLDVESFSGCEAVSQMYRYEISFTSRDNDIDATLLLKKRATLIMNSGLLQHVVDQKIVPGVISDFCRLSGSADEAKYRITLVPFLSLLENQFRTHRFFVNQSVIEVVTQVLTNHGVQEWEFEFDLKKRYPKREQINQYQESDLVFIERLLAEVGIFYFFTLQSETQTEVIHFADQQSAWKFGHVLPLSNPSGTHDNENDSVWDIQVHHHVVEQTVTVNDYNHRDAQSVLACAPVDVTDGEGGEITYGDVYHYRPRHQECGDKIAPATETGHFWARLEHERFLANQIKISGSSTDMTLSPTQVLTIIDSSTSSKLPTVTEKGIVILNAHYTASRKNALRVVWEAIPYSENRCWRPPSKKRPIVIGTLTARVTSAKSHDIYAWQDEAGLYRVKFDADREDKNQGEESMPVRLAKPYGGSEYGFHFPLIQGAEVAIAFHEGDPDRPYIAHVLHDSRHVDPVTEKNSTRNVVRTAGSNKLRMEDQRGEEHIKLSTEYGGKTQLNLGHNVDATNKLRGEGAELRTDDWISIRGGKGIFISADNQPSAQGQMLDMDEAIGQLEQTLALARSMATAATTAKAVESDIHHQQQLNASLSGCAAPSLLLHAPDGVGILSAKSIRLASGSESVGMISGGNTDISTGQSFTVTAQSAVSLLANAQGMQLLASKGKMNIQAQSNALSVHAQKDIDIQSTEGQMTLSAPQQLLLTCGGSYIKLSANGIELGCSGNILMKCTQLQKMAAARLDIDPVDLPKGYSGGFILTDDKGVPQIAMPYRITTAEGDVFHGVTDNQGKTIPINTLAPSSIEVEININK